MRKIETRLMKSPQRPDQTRPDQ